MTKKELKGLIKEIINEVKNGYKLSSKEKKSISTELAKHPELSGNKKFNRQGGKSEALSIINKALNSCGFELDMVTGDLLLGEKGSRLLRISKSEVESFGRKMPSESVYNSGISFSWENLNSDKFNPNIEIIAYLT
jgi:hypothetical protein